MENTGFFKADASLTEQYWENFTKHSDVEPEKRLFAAVLDDAVKNYRKLVVVGGRRFAEEREWIFSDDKKATFSFCNICDVLGLSPTRIRRTLRDPTMSGALIFQEPSLRLPPRPYRRASKAPAAEMRA
jgi:hypothetical protein